MNGIFRSGPRGLQERIRRLEAVEANTLATREVPTAELHSTLLVRGEASTFAASAMACRFALDESRTSLRPSKRPAANFRKRALDQHAYRLWHLAIFRKYPPAQEVLQALGVIGDPQSLEDMIANRHRPVQQEQLLTTIRDSLGGAGSVGVRAQFGGG